MALTATMISRYPAASTREETVADISNDSGVLECRHPISLPHLNLSPRASVGDGLFRIQSLRRWLIVKSLTDLPEGSVITKVAPYSDSAWTRTKRVQVRLSDGTAQDYFMKTCSEDFGALMMEGEFNSLKAMHAHIPASCPEPLGWGECQTRPGTFFLLMEFLHLEPTHPDTKDPDPEQPYSKHPHPKAISKIIVDLHERSTGEVEEFGFPVPNCHGKIIQPNSWDSDWSRYFTNLITAFYKADIDKNGTEAEYGILFDLLKQRVIPRLLEPLQADGRLLRPCLVHGDLWHENIGLDKETKLPMIYDASAFYGHNEYEVGTWRTVFCAFKEPESYRQQYYKDYPPSEPAEEWEDRNRLYSIPFNITHSAGWPGETKMTRNR